MCQRISAFDARGRPMGLHIKERSMNDVTILDLAGQITHDEGMLQLREAVQTALENGQHRILVNLGEVAHVDNAGVGELVSFCWRAQDRGGDFKLLNLSATMQDVVMMTKILNAFEVFDSEKEAVESFGG
ncbi:Anti-sigma B factor antagonist RsbV [Minicystis rosea]|nr:Anti-sigma B factor antagonist RsbV [Minicystis rosea]